MTNRVYEQFLRQISSDKVMCLNCGAINPLGVENCENCDNELQQPKSLWLNMLDTIIRPMKAMARIAATMPIMQAFLAVIVAASIFIFFQVFTYYESLQDALGRIDELWRNVDTRNTLLDPNFHPIPGIVEIAINYFVFFLSWLFFTIAVFYTLRLLYRREARISYKSLAAVAGFGRVVTIFSFIFLLPLGDFSYALRILLLVWQIVVDTIGVRYSTGLSYNKAIIAVIIPALIFQFIGMPI